MLFLTVISTRIPSDFEGYDWSKNYLRIFGIRRHKEGKKFYLMVEFKGDPSVISSLRGKVNNQDNIFVGYIESEDPLFAVLSKYHLVSAHLTPTEFLVTLYLIHKSEMKDLIRSLLDVGVSVKVVKVIRLKPNAGLTQKQFEAIRVAYSMGYYDFPRRVGIREVAERLGLSVSTTTELLRRAEKRLVEAYLRGIT